MLHQGWSPAISSCSMHVRHAPIVMDSTICSKDHIRNCELRVMSEMVLMTGSAALSYSTTGRVLCCLIALACAATLPPRVYKL